MTLAVMITIISESILVPSHTLCFLIDTPVVVLWLVVLKEVQQKQHQFKEEREEETKKAMREAAILAEAPEVPVVPVRYQTSPTWCSIYLEPFYASARWGETGEATLFIRRFSYTRQTPK